MAPRKTWTFANKESTGFFYFPSTVSLLLLMARIAAMKKVLSPISETRITDRDSTKPCKKPKKNNKLLSQIQNSNQPFYRCPNRTSMFSDIKSRLLCNADVCDSCCFWDPCGIYLLWIGVDERDLWGRISKKKKFREEKTRPHLTTVRHLCWGLYKRKIDSKDFTLKIFFHLLTEELSRRGWARRESWRFWSGRGRKRSWKPSSASETSWVIRKYHETIM